jgi:hypothetical protein
MIVVLIDSQEYAGRVVRLCRVDDGPGLVGPQSAVGRNNP